MQIRRLEPNVVAYSALYSPNTGITDYGLVAQCIANEIVQSGWVNIDFLMLNDDLLWFL